MAEPTPAAVTEALAVAPSQVTPETDAKTGEVLAAFDASALLAGLPESPGVYRMLDRAGQVIYVGKALNLKKRVSSYFSRQDTGIKTRTLVAQIGAVDITVTNTEKEALLLENNLIKAIRPRYNILLRDDKSYPYIYLDTSQSYPRLGFHRGSRKAVGRYFGPYPSASAVRQTLNILQKLFRLRQCEDSFFSNRSRPCLQYQIKRCTAPCVDFIAVQDYAEDLRLAVLFLQGNNSQIIAELGTKMEQASAALKFETAARYRDQILTLRRIEEKQYVSADAGDLDIVACVCKAGFSCVQVFYIRAGHNLGNKVFYPKQGNQTEAADVLAAFLSQYYLSDHRVGSLPDEILLNLAVPEQALLETVLSERREKKLSIRHSWRAERAKWVKMAEDNARLSLASHLSAKASQHTRFEALQDALHLDNALQRIECFDISHTQGEATVASCVVMEQEGFVKSDFRRFNIKDITPGDDYAAMRQALTRRYVRLKQGEGLLPDILLIDGGPGQTQEALQVLSQLQIEGVMVLGVAKGPERRPGAETLFLNGNPKGFALAAESPALHLIQQVRDEAHRFAITAHRGRRAKARRTSSLEQIEGLGPKRRRSLLLRFGGLQEVQRASVDELMSVTGIHRQLAQRIYAVFHDSHDSHDNEIQTWDD